MSQSSVIMPSRRVRIKICGLTRNEDVDAAVAAGADALGFVFYEKSQRYVTPERAAELLARVPPFVSTVGLFVNASAEQVRKVVDIAPTTLLQFHGDETNEECIDIAGAVGIAFLKAIRIGPMVDSGDLIKSDTYCRANSALFKGLLLDTLVDGYGGGGKVFDWSIIPEKLAPRVVLSGGLSARNVADAVARVRPYGLDVSSGVEHSKGIKDAEKIAAFVHQATGAQAALGLGDTPLR